MTHGRIKQKYTTKMHNNDTFDGSIGFIDNKKWTKSTTMDIMTKKGGVSYFPFHWVRVHVFSFGTLKKEREE
jgi:hypothetical protein